MKEKIKAFLAACVVFCGAAFSPAEAVNAENSSESEKLRVMPLGDSITDGFSTTGGYRNRLCELISENGYSDRIDFVGPNWGGSGYDPQHAGYSGYSIDNIAAENSISGQRTGLSSFIEWLMTEYPSDVVMLQIGTNDILSLYDLDNIGTRLENLVDTILKYIPEDGRLCLATIPCMDATNNLYINSYFFTTESMDEHIYRYNAEIRKIAAKKHSEGKNVVLADVYTVLSKEDLCDGVHPSESGYAKLGEFWYTMLTDYMNGTETPPEQTQPEYSLTEILMLMRHLLNKEPLSVELGEKLDLNNDKIIDVFDLILLKQEMKPLFDEYKAVVESGNDFYINDDFVYMID